MEGREGRIKGEGRRGERRGREGRIKGEGRRGREGGRTVIVPLCMMAL